MKTITLTIEDLRGFLDKGETISCEQLNAINKEYENLCSSADSRERYDYYTNYDNEGYYPPFVAQAVNNVLK